MTGSFVAWLPSCQRRLLPHFRRSELAREPGSIKTRVSPREVEPAELAEAKHLSFTADPEQLRACNVFIVTVPTPVDSAPRPDLTP